MAKEEEEKNKEEEETPADLEIGVEENIGTSEEVS